jgi:hypothetical protein
MAEAVAMRLLADAGINPFSQADPFDGHGVDLLALTEAGEVIAVEVKGTLRAGRLPRLGRTRHLQMSLEWLNRATNPAMVNCELVGRDVCGAIMSLDFARPQWRAVLSGDFLYFGAERDLSRGAQQRLTSPTVGCPISSLKEPGGTPLEHRPGQSGTL